MMFVAAGVVKRTMVNYLPFLSVSGTRTLAASSSGSSFQKKNSSERKNTTRPKNHKNQQNKKLAYGWAKNPSPKAHQMARAQNGEYKARQVVLDDYAKHMKDIVDELKGEYKRLVNEGIINESTMDARKIQAMLMDAANDKVPPFPIQFQTGLLGQRLLESDVVAFQEDAINTPPFVPMSKDFTNQPGMLREHTVFSKRISNMTRGGRRPSMSVLSIVGTGNGGVGYAVAKASETGVAEEQALKRAKNKMIFIPRLNDRTIAHDIQAHYKKTKLYLRPAKEGSGVKAQPLVRIICELAGITDLTADLFGSTNPLNIVRVTMKALQSQIDPIEVAKRRGKVLLKIDDPGKMPEILYEPPSDSHALELPHLEKTKLFRNWLISFPQPENIVALGNAKQLFDVLKVNGQLASGESSALDDVSATMDTDVLKWISDRPAVVLEDVDFIANAHGSFLDANFWPGSVETCISMAKEKAFA
eukprot:m.136922 g.136922  ORF g.136922 m.136922 type:complete len:474 (-) comp11062_c0_seq1:89-1510(-)